MWWNFINFFHWIKYKLLLIDKIIILGTYLFDQYIRLLTLKHLLWRIRNILTFNMSFKQINEVAWLDLLSTPFILLERSLNWFPVFICLSCWPMEFPSKLDYAGKINEVNSNRLLFVVLWMASDLYISQWWFINSHWQINESCHLQFQIWMLYSNFLLKSHSWSSLVHGEWCTVAKFIFYLFLSHYGSKIREICLNKMSTNCQYLKKVPLWGQF